MLCHRLDNVLRRECLRTTVLGWRNYVLQVSQEGLATENARLMRVAGQAEKNIWAMNKESLVEVAKKEMGYTLPQAQQLRSGLR